MPWGCGGVRVTDLEREQVLRRARQSMLAQVRYFSGEEDIPARVLTDAARHLYIYGTLPLEAFEWFLDLELGLL